MFYMLRVFVSLKVFGLVHSHCFPQSMFDNKQKSADHGSFYLLVYLFIYFMVNFSLDVYI